MGSDLKVKSKFLALLEQLGNYNDEVGKWLRAAAMHCVSHMHVVAYLRVTNLLSSLNHAAPLT